MKRITINKPGATTLLAILLLTFFTVLLSSCADPYYPSNGYYRHGRYYKQMPPGQAKKYYGAQSARDFAPGHNKRRY